MKIVHRYDEQALLIKISGKMNVGDAEEFLHRVMNLLVPGVTEVEIDLSQLETLASLALAKFTLLSHQLEAEDIRLRFVHLSPMLTDLFEVVGLGMLVGEPQSNRLRRSL